MSTLNITLNPVAVDRLYEALTCLSKFGDSVTLEARRNKLNLRTLNPTHSAHILICLAGDTFCDYYNYVPDASKLPASFGSGGNGGSQVSQRLGEEGSFNCKMNVKALLPVFRGRYVLEAINKERDENLVQGIEKCEIVLQEKESKVQCRLVVKLFCRNGVMKTFRLQYEEADVIYATFLKEWGVNKWAIRAGELKKWMEHFGPKTEHLEIAPEEDRVNFTSYTLKIIDGPHILKTPLQTSIELDLIEFNEFQVTRDTSIAINVKDFKSIVTHAGTFEHVQIQAAYGEAGQPMQITYDQSGMFCEFTLMTRKKGAAGPAVKAEPVAKIMSHRNAAAVAGSRGREVSVALSKGSTPVVPPTLSQRDSVFIKPSSSRMGSVSAEMPPPPLRVTPRAESVAAAVLNSKDSPLVTGRQNSAASMSGLKGSLQPRPSQSLFLMDEDEDDVFGPAPGTGDDQFEALLDDFDDEDVLGWDASLGSEKVSFVELQERAVSGDKGKATEKEQREERPESGSYVEPTQRKNVVKGLFD